MHGYQFSSHHYLEQLCSAREHYEGGGQSYEERSKGHSKADARFLAVYDQHSSTVTDAHDTNGHYGATLREDA